MKLMRKISILLICLVMLFALTGYANAAESADVVYTKSSGSITVTVYADGLAKFEGTGTLEEGMLDYEVTRVEIGKGITAIGTNAFYGYTNLTSVKLPEGLEKIGSGAFFRTGLTSVSIPDTVTDLAYDIPEGESALGAFDCPNLRTVKLSKNLKRIPYACFSGTALENVEIPDGVISIENYAFGFCPRLTSITIPASVTHIGWFAFGNTFSLTNVIFLGDAPGMDSSFYCASFNGVAFYPKGNATWADADNIAWMASLNAAVPYTLDALGNIIPEAPSEANISGAIQSFWYTYPQGTSYPSNYSYIINGNMLTAYGDEAFAFELSDACFGYLPISDHRTVSYNSLKLGDILYFSDGPWVITELDASGVKIAGVTSGNTVCYDYPMTRAEVEATALSYRTRYGVSPGNCVVDPALSYEKINGLGHVPTETEAYEAMMALQAKYPEGMPYSEKNHYHNNVTWFVEEHVTVSQDGHGCSAFAGILSDTVFGDMPARYFDVGDVDYDRIMVGDRLFTLAHEMVVMEVYKDCVVIAEGNYDGRIHWGRIIAREEIESHYALVTRYPEGTVPGERVAYEEKTDENEETGWVYEDGKWYYFDEEGNMVTDAWRKDSKGWCYLGSDGAMVTNCWLEDSKGWCYIGPDGYCETNCWKQDSYGWLYLDSEGSMTKNTWVDGYYLDSEGYMATNKWVYDNGYWYYLDSSGLMVTNAWRKDSYGWCYLGSDGAMVTNCWLQDSKGWCYIGANGYCETNCWKQDSYGWLYLDSEGSMTKEEWVFTDGAWYYLDAEGYMVTGEQEIDGTWYVFSDSGVWIG